MISLFVEKKATKDQKHRARAFALFYAILLGGIILAVGASMLNLSLKELILSQSLRESEYAFFAADSGTECALYWDLHGIPVTFPTSSGAPANTGNIHCNGDVAVSLPSPTVVSSATSATTTFGYNVGLGQYCTVVSVGKQINADQSVTTTVDARGYNLPCSSTSNRKVERAITTQYGGN